MNIIVYEDNSTEFLKPFTLNHATFELRCGAFTNLERIEILFEKGTESFSDYNFILLVRSEIEDIIRFRYPHYEVNPIKLANGKYINGSNIYMQFSDVFLEDSPNVLDQKIINNAIDSKHMFQINNIWDCIFNFNNVFRRDFELLGDAEPSYFEIFPHLYTSDCDKGRKIKISEFSNLKEGVILDASNGPIFINNATIDIGALLQGPLFIDEDSYVAPGAKIRSGTMIGKNCKVGGEVSNSIFYANSNKVHDGFIGDSFIGEWVNIGAGTNNSNLKNNYSNIKFSFDGNETIDTGLQFLGSMIGDYARIGISTMLNTGTYIGLGANVFGSGFQNKHIPSYSWGKDGQKTDFNKFIETCKKMYLRRGKEISSIEIELLQFLYNQK